MHSLHMLRVIIAIPATQRTINQAGLKSIPKFANIDILNAYLPSTVGVYGNSGYHAKKSRSEDA